MTKVADNKGRIMLGSEYANGMFIVEESEGRIVLTPAVSIPASEAWLYKNQDAMNLVRRGLAQAKAGARSKAPPDLDADDALVGKLDGD